MIFEFKKLNKNSTTNFGYLNFSEKALLIRFWPSDKENDFAIALYHFTVENKL
jgi:hypothetical protein